MSTQIVSPPTAGTFDTAQHRAHRWGLAPRGVAVEGVLVLLGRAVEILVDPDQAGVLGVAAGDGVVLQRTEALCELHVVGAADVLVTEEQDLVSQEELVDLGEDRGVVRGVGQADVAQLGADEGLVSRWTSMFEPRRASLGCAWARDSVMVMWGLQLVVDDGREDGGGGCRT